MSDKKLHANWMSSTKEFFTKADTNKDNKLDEKEYMQYVKH